MKRTILIADDSFVIRSVLRIYLESRPYRILEARDGNEALAALRLEPVDVVIADVDMPGKGGLDLARALRDDPKLARIPLVLITGRPVEQIRAAAEQAGARKTLPKPVSGPGVLDAIEGLLDARRTA